jgi:hypothetical protein
MASAPGDRHDLEVGEPVTLSIAVDHGQFIILDGQSEIDTDEYGQEASAAGLAQWSGGIAVFCDSHWTGGTTVVVTRVNDEPSLELAAFDHVVLAGLSCATGRLHVFAPEETGVAERVLSLPAGSYAVLVCGDRFGKGDEYGDNGEDRYSVWLWPSGAPPERRVLKPGHPGA